MCAPVTTANSKWRQHFTKAFMHCCHRNRSGNFWQGWKGEYLTLLRKQEGLTQAEMAGKICYIGMAHYGKRVCVKWEYKTK